LEVEGEGAKLEGSVCDPPTVVFTDGLKLGIASFSTVGDSVIDLLEGEADGA
jgi:hypothetical protein